MQKENKLYETTFIVNAALDDAQIDAVIEKVRDIIVKNGGETTSTEKWGRKRLAYTIEKKNNGFYAFFEFKGPGDLIAKLERHYHLEEQIIRHLTIQLEKKALKAKERAAAAALTAASATPIPTVTPVTVPVATTTTTAPPTA